MRARLAHTTVLQWLQHVRVPPVRLRGSRRTYERRKRTRIERTHARECIFHRYNSNDGRSCAMIHVINLQVSFFSFFPTFSSTSSVHNITYYLYECIGLCKLYSHARSSSRKTRFRANNAYYSCERTYRTQ